MLVTVLAIVGTAVWIDVSMRRTPALTALADRPPSGSGTTWLLVGSDSRQDLTPEQQAELTTGGDVGNGRTDTILLVHVPSLGSDVPPTMVSIPRDSYLPIPGYGEDKVNAAFALGGAPLLAQTVEQATGLRLDHYAEIGFDGFAAMVDAVGGVTMCPPEPISDPLAGIDLPAGCQELDGRSALGLRPDQGDTARRPRSDDQPASVHGDPAAPRRQPRRVGQPAALVPDGPCGLGCGDGRRGAHVWDLARLGWALHGTVVTTTVPIGGFTDGDVGSVVVWNSDAATRLFHALATDAAVPADVLDADGG